MTNRQNSLTCGSGSKRYPIATITNRTITEESAPAIWTKEARNDVRVLRSAPKGQYYWLANPSRAIHKAGCSSGFWSLPLSSSILTVVQPAVLAQPGFEHGKLQWCLLAQAEKSGNLVKLQILALELQKACFVSLKIWVYIPEFSHRCFPEQDSETSSKWLKSFGKMTPQSCIFPRQ